MDAIKAIAQGLQGMGGDEQQPSMMPAQAMRPEQSSRNDLLAPTAQSQPMSAVNQMASTTIPTGGGSMMPASVGIGSLPGMNNETMMAGFSPDQRNMISGYLGGQGMRGFA
jgi:hypothetical protein